MGFLSSLGKLFHREHIPTPEERAELEAVKKQIRDRCKRFRSLLSANKTALEIMSDIEEHLSGTRPFGMEYIRGAGTRAAASVYQMVRELNSLTGNAYPELPDAFSRVSGHIDTVLKPAVYSTDGPLVLPLQAISLANIQEVGGKMANLGEVSSGAGLPVPSGFAVTVTAYRLFLKENGLAEEIEKRIRATDMDDMSQLFTLSAGLQQAVQQAPLPAALEDAIWGQIEILVDKYMSEDIRLALRSSAVGEDALGASFAGQYRTELNVLPDEVCDIWKEIVASKYTVAALSYRYQRGIPDDAAPMSVGVLRMVRALAGGVAYSEDPVSEGKDSGSRNVVLNSVPGLPEAVVDGGVMPDTFTFSHSHPARLVSRHIACKASRLDTDTSLATGIRKTMLTPEEGSAPSITDEQAREVARITLALEEYYAKPQDVEWALETTRDGKGTHVIILQSRPLQLEKAEDGAETQPETGEEDVPVPPEEILLQGGISVSSGVALGPVHIVHRDLDMLSFPKGGILVVERAYPRWATLLPRAAGMISENGGTAGHLASVCREYHVPALFSLAAAVKTLSNGREITLDANHQRVLSGLHRELLQGDRTHPRLMDGSPVMKALQDAAQYIVPLHLLDPDSSDFRPEKCTSLHDITRFCHEKSANFIFSGDTDISRSMGKQLRAGAKLQYWIIDMDDGFTRDVQGPVVDISEIASKPMLALWDGMCAIPWNGPPTGSAAGLMSVVFESTMNPELEVTAPNTMAMRNYFIISSAYMLLQARYGYHFCTVEALASSEKQENFVSFQFKGGAADVNRRKLRTAMISGLLEPYGFRVDLKGDSLYAVSEDMERDDILIRTELIGYLLIHTRQSDMIMEDDDLRESFRSKLEDDMKKVCDRARARLQGADAGAKS